MKKLLSLAAFVTLASLLFSAAFADEYVRGYTRRDGTVVQPYMRSSPDSSYNNNWSVSPNVNPYTGQPGTRPPTLDDRPPRSNSLAAPPYHSSGNPHGDPLGRRY